MRKIKSAHALLAGIFVVLGWFYLELIHLPLIDPLVTQREPGPETDLYFHVQDSLDDLARWLPWFLLYLVTPYRHRLVKFTWLVLSTLFLFAFLDLQITGNLNPSLSHPIAFGLALSWGAFVWIAFWRDKPGERKLDPGKVYRIERKPRNFVEWLGTVFLFRWAGSTSHWGAGKYYYFNPKELKLVREKQEFIHLRRDQRAIPLDLTPEEFTGMMEGMLGMDWSVGACFRVSRKLVQKK